MAVRDGWDVEPWERRQGWRRLVIGGACLVLFVVVPFASARSLTGVGFGVFCVVLGGLSVLAVALRGSRVRVPCRRRSSRG